MALENNTNVVTVSGLARVVEGIRGWVENSAAAHSAYRVHSAEEWAIIFADDPKAPDLGNYVFDAKYVNDELQDIKESVVEVASATSADMEVIAAALNDLDERINATSGKADKVTGATSGHLAMLDSEGDLDDSGIPMSSVSDALERLSEIEPGAQVNVIESVKLGETELTPESKVVTIPLFNGSVNGVVVAPTSASRIDNAFLSGTGSWNEMTPVTNSQIDIIFAEGPVIGGREYKTVRIGNQEWLAENLDYKFGGDDYSIYSYYDNDEATYGLDGTYKCGLLYNYQAVKYLDDHKATLLPEGWHVPTKTEWDTLATTIGGMSGGATKLKAKNNSVTSNYPSNWNGTDEYGFKALPSGAKSSTFELFGTYTGFRTVTESSSGMAYIYDFRGADLRAFQYVLQSALYSLRLVKNVT